MRSDGVFSVDTVERGCPGGGEKGERGREEIDTAFSWMGLCQTFRVRSGRGG
jgi:hypothetical protein